MAGPKMFSAPSGIQYANGAIFGGSPPTTRSLLSCLTNVSGAVPTPGGDRMSITTSGDYGYAVVSGTYAGSYYINRNDPQGAIIWSNMSSGFYSFDLLHDYQNWTPDNYLEVRADIAPPDNFDFAIRCGGGGQLVFRDTMTNPNYNLSSTPMASAPGSSGAFDVGANNTNWNTSFSLSVPSPSFPQYNVQFDVRDLYSGNIMYSNNIILDPTNGYAYSDNFNTKYYYVMQFLLSIN